MEKNYLIDGPVPHDSLSKLVEKAGKSSDTGAQMIFLGQVRADEVEEKKVKAIEYSAYEELVNAEADRIKASIRSEFSDVRSVDIVHSTGIVRAGEISLLVFVSAGHRNHAMQACNKTVELIKERLPVWKKEIFEDDSHIWK
jgi:molybdopterin synthase catalytic subunit